MSLLSGAHQYHISRQLASSSSQEEYFLPNQSSPKTQRQLRFQDKRHYSGSGWSLPPQSRYSYVSPSWKRVWGCGLRTIHYVQPSISPSQNTGQYVLSEVRWATIISTAISVAFSPWNASFASDPPIQRTVATWLHLPSRRPPGITSTYVSKSFTTQRRRSFHRRLSICSCPHLISLQRKT